MGAHVARQGGGFNPASFSAVFFRPELLSARKTSSGHILVVIFACTNNLSSGHILVDISYAPIMAPRLVKMRHWHSVC